jgi:hypothetical protein
MRSESNLLSQTDNPHSSNNKQEGPSDSNYAHIKARLSWLAGRPCVRPVSQGLVSYCLKSMVELTHSTYKYPTTPFCEMEIRK